MNITSKANKSDESAHVDLQLSSRVSSSGVVLLTDVKGVKWLRDDGLTGVLYRKPPDTQ